MKRFCRGARAVRGSGEFLRLEKKFARKLFSFVSVRLAIYLVDAAIQRDRSTAPPSIDALN